MSYSIMDMGNSTKSQSKQSLTTLADLEQSREITNNQIDSQKKSSQMTGAASGAIIGTQVLPGWGTAIGAGIGLLAGSL
jgi:uncharacterized membrane protein